MAKKKVEEEIPQKQQSKKQSLFMDIKEETAEAVLAIIFFVIAVLAILAWIGKAGLIGEYFYEFFQKLFGIGYFLVPIFFTMIGVALVRGIQTKFRATKVISSIVFLISSLGLVDLLPSNNGGILGHVISTPLLGVFDIYFTTTLLFALLLISTLITLGAHLNIAWLESLKHFIFRTQPKTLTPENEDDKMTKMVANATKEAFDRDGAEDNEAAPEERKPVMGQEIKKPKPAPLDITPEEESSFAALTRLTQTSKPFVPPPISLLEKDKGKPEVGDIKANANIIKRTLLNFGISVEMDEISIGPSVTRYALKPAEGVKLSKIVALGNDLSLALAAHPIRIEAPIPGKSLVGIEIPNSTKTTVGLATLLSNAEFSDSDKPLLIALGKSVTGKSYYTNVAKTPHLLIAGATGSGKSVSIHTLITSLLYRNSPENLKFIMIDPKRVELTLYNKIPHLLTPVITDAKKAILSLKGAAKEMSRRYDVLEGHSVRDIDSYHKNILTPGLKKAEEKRAKGEEITSSEVPETMPYIVVVIDELADIMQSYPKELESSIVRLAQMSRAVGIHLILSTQRPSVNVITGLIKANVPSRLALQVASQIDSRTILDAAGAEKLLGAGDMLYQGGDMPNPQRLQSAYISETELKRVVQYLADAYRDEIMGEINLTTPEVGANSIFESSFDGDGDTEEDEMFGQAREVVIGAGKASTSYLQRKLGVGYSRAAKLMDMLEEKGVIGPANGSKPREVLGAPSSGDESSVN